MPFKHPIEYKQIYKINKVFQANLSVQLKNY